MDKRIYEGFEAIAPTEEQSAKIWREIERKRWGNHRKMPKILRFAAVFAMIAVMIISIGTITNMATGGRVIEVIKIVLGIEQGSQSVTGQAVYLAERGTEVWAPDIYGMNDEYIIFGTHRGLVVYDRINDGISATIDTQEVGCIYFDSMEKSSHVLLEGDTVAVYNSEGGVPYGECYVYNIRETGELDYQTGSAEELHGKWLAHEKNYGDTFDMYHESLWYNELDGKRGDMYSRRALMYDGCYNFLVIADNEYVLYTEAGGAFETHSLSMGLLYETEEEQSEVLPMFEYTGDNKAVAAICDWYYDEAVRHAESGQVWVPGFIICHEADKKGEHLVFGNFWSYGYKKNGSMMEETSGGEAPACFHLKELDDGSYTVVSVDRARDGSYYAKDIKAFCKGYPGLASKIMKNDAEERRAAREYMAMYVRDNDIDVRYIKKYGWDPYEIFE